jgi:hypothetical protein
MIPRPWEDIVQEKRDARTNLIQTHLAETIDEGKRDSYESILNISDIDALVTLLANGSLTVKLVTQAYIRRYAS